MKKKLINWVILISIILFVLYGLIYHTYVVLFFILIIFGSGYAAVVWGKKIKDYIDDLR